MIRRRVDWETIDKGTDVELIGKCFYLMLSASDVKELISELVDNCVRLEFETIRSPDEKVVKTELIESAKQHGIDTRKVEAFFNQAA